MLPIEKRQKQFRIGIDPGKTTGIAVFDLHKKAYTETLSADFHAAYALLADYPPDCVEKVVIEVPHTKAVWHKAHRRSAQDRTAVNVGSVLREAELLCERAIACGHKLVKVHPTGKLSKQSVKKLTGYDGKPNNEHVRDAIMLAF